MGTREVKGIAVSYGIVYTTSEAAVFREGLERGRNVIGCGVRP